MIGSFEGLEGRVAGGSLISSAAGDDRGWVEGGMMGSGPSYRVVLSRMRMFVLELILVHSWFLHWARGDFQLLA